jgi:hypothetical protein
MTDPLRKPDALGWDPAAVELPEIPMIPAGQDALSATISAVLPTLAAPLVANVATLQAKETMFAGKLGAAQVAYQNSDDAGSQSVGQIVGMLGQVGQVGQQAGQMGQMAGAPAQALGGSTGIFGSLMQQAMQGTKGGGGEQSSGGQNAGGAAGATGVAGGGPVASGGQPQQSRDESGGTEERTTEQRQEPQPHEREPLQRAETSDRAAAGPTDSGRGQAALHSPEHQRGDEGLGRRT